MPPLAWLPASVVIGLAAMVQPIAEPEVAAELNGFLWTGKIGWRDGLVHPHFTDSPVAPRLLKRAIRIRNAYGECRRTPPPRYLVWERERDVVIYLRSEARYLCESEVYVAVSRNGWDGKVVSPAW